MKSIVGTIDRVAFSFGPFTVYWYGIIIGAAMLLAITLASKAQRTHNPLKSI